MKLMTFKNNIKYNYMFTFLNRLDFTRGYWMIYLKSRGFTLTQLGIFECVFHLTSFFMETPTGALADIFGRKSSRILGRIMTIIYILVILKSTGFYSVCFAFILCALGYNFESGSGEALVYDSLKENNEEQKFMKIQSNIEVIFQLASALALIVGGYSALKKQELPFIVTIAVTIASLIPLLMIKETNIDKDKTKKMRLKDAIVNQYVKSFKAIKNKKRLLMFIIILNLMGSLITVSFFYLQNYWKSLGHLESTIGIFLALHSLASAFGGFIAHKVEKRIGEKNILIYIPFLIVIFMFGLIFENVSFYAMMALGVLDSIFYVVLSDYMNRIIESSERATLLSMSSMFFSFSMIIIFPIFGAIGDSFSLEISFLSLFIFSVIVYIIYLSKFNKFFRTNT